MRNQNLIPKTKRLVLDCGHGQPYQVAGRVAADLIFDLVDENAQYNRIIRNSIPVQSQRFLFLNFVIYQFSNDIFNFLFQLFL